MKLYGQKPLDKILNNFQKTLNELEMFENNAMEKQEINAEAIVEMQKQQQTLDDQIKRARKVRTNIEGLING